MKEKMAIQTSDLDDHIRTLHMQMKDVEDKLHLHTAGSPSSFVVATVAWTSSPTLTPNLTSTSLSSQIVDVHADPSQFTTVIDVASALHVANITTNDEIEYIDAADANEYIIFTNNICTLTTTFSH